MRLCCREGTVLALDQFLRVIADDWESTRAIGERLATRRAAPFLPRQQGGNVLSEHDPDPAVTPPRTVAGSGSPIPSR